MNASAPPKVSVCVITYNHEAYIAQALESVLTQRTNFPLELVVGEDCSTDRTRDVLRQIAADYPERVRLLLPERNLGVGTNLRDTYHACSGEYVALLEGDDYWTRPDKLQRQIDFLDAHPDYSFCFHPVEAVTPDGSRRDVISFTRSDFAFEDLFPDNFVPTCSVVFRRHLTPVLPDWFRDALPADWPLHLLNAQHGRFRMLPNVMAAYRVHSGGVWSGNRSTYKHGRSLRMLADAREHFGLARRPLFDWAIVHQRFYLAWAAAAEGDPVRARQELSALLDDPTSRSRLSRFKIAALRWKLRCPVLFGACASVWRHLARSRGAVKPLAQTPRPAA